MSAADLARRSQVESIWSERLVHADAMNAERRATWESRKAVIFERDLPVSVPTVSASNVRELRAGRSSR